MNEPTATGQQGGGAPPVGGAGDQTGGGAPQGGGTPQGGAPAGGDMSTQQMIDKFSGLLTSDPENVTEDEKFRIEQTARNKISDMREDLRETLPDATNGQMMDLIEGIMNEDVGMVVKAVMAAMKVAEEKQSQSAQERKGDLKVQTGGSGKQGEQKAAKSMGESVVNAADMFK